MPYFSNLIASGISLWIRCLPVLLLANLVMEQALACTAPKNAFCVDYFAGKTAAGKVLATMNETAIKHAWGAGSPNAAIPTDNFSGHWSGKFTFPDRAYVFKVTGDDGFSLKVDGGTVIESWKDQALTTKSTTVTLTPGESHRIDLEYYEANGAANIAVAWEPVLTCDFPVGQFCVSYYDNRTLSGNPKLIDNESTINHVWGTSSPNTLLPADGFSARWQGDFDFTPGTYAFMATADDGIRWWIDGQPLVDAWIAQAGTKYEQVKWLEGRHRVVVEYYEGYGSAQLIVGWTLLSSTTVPPDPIGSNTTSPVGTNLGEWKDWSTEQPFIDVFKVSRGWITQAPGVWDTGEAALLDLDARGWVRSLPAATDTTKRYRTVTTLILNGSDLNGIRQGGEYVVLYDGEGRIDYALGAAKIAAKSTPGRDVIMVDRNHSGGIQLTIAVTDPQHTGNYIRNIRVVPPGTVCDDDLLAFCLADNDPACQRSACRTTESAVADRLYHPLFLRTLVHYSAIRYMNPLATNVNATGQAQVTAWNDRAQLDSARWSGQSGAPPEAIFHLSNLLGADPWVNMPHRADDNYILQFARLAHQMLDPTRIIYVEYANEAWNSGFSASLWMEARALETWPTAPDSAFTKRINWYGKRTAEVCDIWKQEWGTDAARVVCVMAGQAANSYVARTALNCPLWSGAPCASHGISAIAIAPYFGSYLGNANVQTTLDSWLTEPDGGLSNLFSELDLGGGVTGSPVGGALAQASQWVAQHAELAQQRGLRLLAYEGGQHLAAVGNVANNAGIVQLFSNANRDPRMTTLYSRYLQEWNAAGGDLFMHYLSTGQYGRYGNWGVLENQKQMSSPKMEALIQYIQDYPL